MQFMLLIVLPILLVISFLCAGMETGVFALSRWRIKQLSRRNAARAKLLYRYLENSENFLWTILVGNTLAAFTSIWIIARAIQTKFLGQPGIQIVLFAVAVFAFYAFCDLLPKMLFRQFPNRLCLFAAPIFRLLHIVLSPLVTVVEALGNYLLRWTGGKLFTGHLFGNRSELRLFMQDTGQSLTTDEKAMINRVLDLPTMRVRQITTPMDKLPAISSSASLAEAYTFFKGPHHNSLPVMTGEARNRRVAGILHLKSVLFNANVYPQAPVSAYLSSVLYIDEDASVEQVLRRLQKTGQRLAVVLARNREELGIVTLESVLNVVFEEVQR